MTWIWLSSTVFLLGAQINAEMEMQTDRDPMAVFLDGRSFGSKRHAFPPRST